MRFFAPASKLAVQRVPPPHPRLAVFAAALVVLTCTTQATCKPFWDSMSRMTRAHAIDFLQFMLERLVNEVLSRWALRVFRSWALALRKKRASVLSNPLTVQMRVRSCDSCCTLLPTLHAGALEKRRAELRQRGLLLELDDAGLDAAAVRYVEAATGAAAAPQRPWREQVVRATALTEAGTLEPSRLLTALLAVAGVRNATLRHSKQAEAELRRLEAHNGINGASPLTPVRHVSNISFSHQPQRCSCVRRVHCRRGCCGGGPAQAGAGGAVGSPAC